jgi:hypothetical protein
LREAISIPLRESRHTNKLFKHGLDLLVLFFQPFDVSFLLAALACKPPELLVTIYLFDPLGPFDVLLRNQNRSIVRCYIDVVPPLHKCIMQASHRLITTIFFLAEAFLVIEESLKEARSVDCVEQDR